MIVVMQIWDGDKELSVSTASAVKKTYPNCQLGVLANNCVHPKELEDYADLIHTTSEDVYHERSGGLAIHELLVLGLRMAGKVIVKIDPNTKISFQEGLEKELDDRIGVLGQISSQAFMNYSSVFALSRNVARAMVDSCILLDPAIRDKASGSQAKLRRYFAPKDGLSSHDWPIAYASSVMGIPHNQSNLLCMAFCHPPRKEVTTMLFKKTSKEKSTGIVIQPSQDDLRSEILAESPEHVGLSKAVEFISMIWGNEGVSISMKRDPDSRLYVGNKIDSDGVLHHSAPKYADIEEAKRVLKEGIFSFNIMNAKPENGHGVSMLVLDVDRVIPDNCNASVILTSHGHSQIFMIMEQDISAEEAMRLISKADFADKMGSRASTLLAGARVPGSASYEEVCLHNTAEDRCTSHKVLADGKVRLVKFVDKFFTYDEALDVVRDLSKFYKVLPPVTEPEPALP